ncbi:FecR domain-containing protein [Alcaligenaceae bacterium A4P071]|nr:FecR domain-containing protein [Alcaligenaceae bacterium A4P071]
MTAAVSPHAASAAAVSPDAALEAAIDWMVQMRSGTMTDAERRRFDAWRAADPRHHAAWAQVSGALATAFEPLRRNGSAHLADTALRVRPNRRRALRNALGLLIAAGAGAAIVNRQIPLATLTADLRTGTGERKTFVLPDGSEVTLNARSAVNVAYGNSERRIHLQAGALFARVMQDTTTPFVASTADGQARTAGAHFMLAREAEASSVAVIEQSVDIINAAGSRATVAAGMGLRFTRDSIAAPLAQLADLAAWRSGMLVARDIPLGDVIDAMRPYRRGLVRVSSNAARLRVLGAFSLDDTERMLVSLAQTLPITVKRFSDVLVMVDTREA